MSIARYIVGSILAQALILAAGCTPGVGSVKQIGERATSCLRYYLPYEHSATARVQAVESLGECGGNEVLPWIRHAIHDESPAVRFAAAMTLGQRGDRTSESNLRKLLASSEASDQIAAAGALHLLGDHGASGRLAEYLFDREKVAAQRHAAFVLGRLGEPGAIKILARTMSSKDVGLKANALESMAILGAKKARASLVGDVYSGLGPEETFALTVLGRLRESEYREIFLDKLGTAQHLETKLAAARALGLLGAGQGYALAESSLGFKAGKDEKNDPASNQTFRVRQLAASALGAIGNRAALPSLEHTMNESDDPRLQIAAAKAILDIVGPRRKKPRIR